ncbi:MAG: hypothetical protein J3R72DRAFT_197385 [Linnemannia gamsii]|nr:MAG: hypothetical protein J3R72DRAFT_197385 [Linnemannia gamsii]
MPVSLHYFLYFGLIWAHFYTIHLFRSFSCLANWKTWSSLSSMAYVSQSEFLTDVYRHSGMAEGVSLESWSKHPCQRSSLKRNSGKLKQNICHCQHTRQAFTLNLLLSYETTSTLFSLTCALPSTFNPTFPTHIFNNPIVLTTNETEHLRIIHISYTFGDNVRVQSTPQLLSYRFPSFPSLALHVSLCQCQLSPLFFSVQCIIKLSVFPPQNTFPHIWQSTIVGQQPFWQLFRLPT